VADALAAGKYEIQPSDASSGHKKRPAKQGPAHAEDDLGYGASHGYGPSHGGPTGPGDAPAIDTDVAPSRHER
jgi:hypothetical protein